MMKKYFSRMFDDWAKQSIRSFESLLEPGGKMVDLGCGDGKLTLQFAKIMKPDSFVGVDAFGTHKKFHIVKGDLNRKLPFPDNTFDAVLSNYSIEHLYNTGQFISETYRILKPGGYTVVATDNLSSWPVILFLIFGYQPSTMASGILDHAIGNPFALRSDDVLDSAFSLKWRQAGEYSHNKVQAYQALVDAYRESGFTIERVKGAGYFPFTGLMSRLLESLDTRHAHLLILKARKSK